MAAPRTATGARTASDRAFLRNVPLLAGLEERTLEALPIASKALRDREVLFRRGDAGDCAYVVVRGRLKITSDAAAGRELLLSILEPGSVLGELALLDGKPRSATAIALGAARLVVIHRREFLPILRGHPDVSLRLLGALADRVRRLNEILEETVYLGMSARLARLLLTLAERHGRPAGEGAVVLEVRLSQSELGQMIGATRESVNKHLRALVEAGIVSLRRGELRVEDRAALQTVARDLPAE